MTSRWSSPGVMGSGQGRAMFARSQRGSHREGFFGPRAAAPARHTVPRRPIDEEERSMTLTPAVTSPADAVGRSFAGLVLGAAAGGLVLLPGVSIAETFGWRFRARWRFGPSEPSRWPAQSGSHRGDRGSAGGAGFRVAAESARMDGSTSSFASDSAPAADCSAGSWSGGSRRSGCPGIGSRDGASTARSAAAAQWPARPSARSGSRAICRGSHPVASPRPRWCAPRRRPEGSAVAFSRPAPGRSCAHARGAARDPRRPCRRRP